LAPLAVQAMLLLLLLLTTLLLLLLLLNRFVKDLRWMRRLLKKMVKKFLNRHDRKSSNEIEKLENGGNALN
jgi:signal transduction histidine kinase